MPDVPILVFEDSALADSTALGKLVGLPRVQSAGGVDYHFNWHPTYNALGGYSREEPLLIRSIGAYREAVRFLRYDLSGQAIILMDLTMFEPDGEKPFNLTEDDVTDDLLHHVTCLNSEVNDKANVLKQFNPQRLGLLLALSAALNSNWEGMIVFISGRDVANTDQVQQCINRRDLLWGDLRISLSAPGGSPLLNRVAGISGVIEAFLKQREGPPFWPAETLGWFERADSVVPHNAPPPDSSPVVVEMVRKYLDQLLAGYVPPESWFQDPQWKVLYETLKHLIGAHSVSSGFTPPGAKNLRLAAVPLLLAAQMAWNKGDKKGDIDWIKSFEWNCDGLVEIMAHDSKLEAQEAIRAMAVFLEHLSVGNNDQVIGAKWGKVANDTTIHLWIDFKIDPLRLANRRSLLQTIFGSRWGNGKGQTVAAYEKMMERAQKSGSSSGPSFSLCIYPEKDAQGQYVTRLDFCRCDES
jgi:hypothetical protein